MSDRNIERVARAMFESKEGTPDWDCVTDKIIRESWLHFARAAIAAMPGWQDISTAPDNVSVLVFVPKYDHYGHGVYRAIHIAAPLTDYEPRWHCTAIAFGRDLITEDMQPTHWMPLPAPPEEE